MGIKELLKKVNEYGVRKYGHDLSLVLENDGSGFIIQNIFQVRTKPILFRFHNIEELKKELNK